MRAGRGAPPGVCGELGPHWALLHMHATFQAPPDVMRTALPMRRALSLLPLFSGGRSARSSVTRVWFLIAIAQNDTCVFEPHAQPAV